MAAGSSPEAGTPLARLPVGEWGTTVSNLCVFGVSWWCLLHYARWLGRFGYKNRKFLVGVMMWLCRSYGRKLYPSGVGVSNDGVDWASFPSVKAFAVRFSAMSMVF
ncbi:hypothetical protein SETIT_5G235100v2 [Setaria italica]|uniref:Uncharacterized protein n=1 Tax=Setaria italica TaxID=4555 RepID=A0A368R802_SETIT|nr:hypothetical protein SETIT_5G235100v2 [Setaria italica]